MLASPLIPDITKSPSDETEEGKLCILKFPVSSLSRVALKILKEEPEPVLTIFPLKSFPIENLSGNPVMAKAPKPLAFTNKLLSIVHPFVS